MTLREIVYKIHADKLHIVDLLSGGTVTIDPLRPTSMSTIERFLHCEVVRLEAAGQDVRILVL